LEGSFAESPETGVLSALFSLRFLRKGSGFVPLYPGYYLARNRHLGYAILCISYKGTSSENPRFSLHPLGFDRDPPRRVEGISTKSSYDWILLKYLSSRIDQTILGAIRGQGMTKTRSR